MPERVAVIGARQHPNLALVEDYVRSLGSGVVIVSGGAAGVDRAALLARIALGRDALDATPDGRLEPVFIEHCISEPAGGSSTFYEEVKTFSSERCNRITRRRAMRWPLRDALLYRNTLIALDCDRMVVFPDGSRGGAWDAAREGLRFRRPVEVRWADGRVEPFRGGRHA